MPKLKVTKQNKDWPEFFPVGKCVDCGAVCSTRRCPKCYAIYIRDKPLIGADPDISYGALEDIFQRIKSRRLH